VLVFEDVVESRRLLALVKGAPSSERPTLCRMHRGSLLTDLWASSLGPGARLLDASIDAIERAGEGVVVYLPPEGPLGAELQNPLTPASRPSGFPEASVRVHGGTLREYGLGAQVLGALGVRQIRLLTNNPKRIPALHGYGLDLVECVPPEAPPG
jgi:3,4-dihydroxy 2-butanone 4-phosphate synthase/GTP cyclohydrolase II